jgi:riboflavin transporter FmnP
MMSKVIRALALLPALAFLFTGLSWLTQPESAAASLGLPLLDGVARSSQIGDMAAFFLSGSFMIFIGLITDKRIWLQAPAMVVGLTAICRILAWLLHDAALPMNLIVPEIVFSLILIFVASRLPKES